MSVNIIDGAAAGGPVTTPRKRSHEGEIIARQSSLGNSNLADAMPLSPTRQNASPAPSNVTSELTELASVELTSPSTSKTVNVTWAPAKKVKLTFAEKEAERILKQKEKEEKARQKADEKTRKEEEKRQRDEEKRKKEEEKEASKRTKELERAEKQKLRDAEKQEKDAEKAKKDAEKKEKEMEKLKKEKSQLRIAAFFGRPAPQSTPPATPDDASSAVSSRRSSVAAIDVEKALANIESDSRTSAEFEKYIIPYFVHENTELAPVNRFTTARTDSFGGKQSAYVLEVENSELECLRTRFGPPRKRMRMMDPVKEIVDRIQKSQIDAADLAEAYNPLAFVPYKVLSFREDIRPPYIGTYSKRLAHDVARKMSRKPLHRGRTDTNYDYDSEAEWEEPAADDEEILDDEMSESDDGDDDMQDFLDDEEDHGKRRMFASEMQPVSSGLCFQGEVYDSHGHNLEEYRMGVLHDSTTFPIDPYSTVHWTDVGKATAAQAKLESGVEVRAQEKSATGSRSMPPPRVPLATVNSSNLLNKYLSPSTGNTASQKENILEVSKPRGRPPNPNKETKAIQDEFLDDFKQAVDGSDLTKAGLIEVLKKQFPRCSKDAIKDTLGVVAVRVGKKEAEKRWVLI